MLSDSNTKNCAKGQETGPYKWYTQNAAAHASQTSNGPRKTTAHLQRVLNQCLYRSFHWTFLVLQTNPRGLEKKLWLRLHWLQRCVLGKGWSIADNMGSTCRGVQKGNEDMHGLALKMPRNALRLLNHLDSLWDPKRLRTWIFSTTPNRKQWKGRFFRRRKKDFLSSFMRPYGKPKQKPGHWQTSCAFLNMIVFTKRKAPNWVCLTDVYPLKNCVLCIYHVSVSVFIAKNPADFPKDTTLLSPSQFSGENTEGLKWGLPVWGARLSHTFLSARPILCSVWLTVLILGIQGELGWGRQQAELPQMDRRQVPHLQIPQLILKFSSYTSLHSWTPTVQFFISYSVYCSVRLPVSFLSMSKLPSLHRSWACLRETDSSHFSI